MITWAAPFQPSLFSGPTCPTLLFQSVDHEESFRPAHPEATAARSSRYTLLSDQIPTHQSTVLPLLMKRKLFLRLCQLSIKEQFYQRFSEDQPDKSVFLEVSMSFDHALNYFSNDSKSLSIIVCPISWSKDFWEKARWQEPKT
jgi:hypothetical protein